jgi:hypothetical protein
VGGNDTRRISISDHLDLNSPVGGVRVGSDMVGVLDSDPGPTVPHMHTHEIAQSGISERETSLRVASGGVHQSPDWVTPQCDI